MKGLLFLIVLMFTLGSYAQEKPPVTSPKLQDAKSEMVLRGTTRDQEYMIKDNMHREQVHQRKQASVTRQQMMLRKRLNKMQKQRLMQRRAIQQRRIKQQAIRRQQINRR